jgi:hypothetical protein
MNCIVLLLNASQVAMLVLAALLDKPQLAAAQTRQTKAGCPPPVGQFLMLRERPPRRVRKRLGEEIARIAVRENNYFGRTRCSIPAEIQKGAVAVSSGGGGGGGRPLSALLHIVEGELDDVEEEESEVGRGLDLRSSGRRRRRLKSCTLYLAAVDFAATRLEVTVLLLTELIPGLAAYCDSPLTAHVQLTVEFCPDGGGGGTKAAEAECTLPRDNRCDL